MLWLSACWIGLPLQSGAAQIYWSDVSPFRDVIQRSDLDGSNVVTLVGDVTPEGMAVDLAGGHIYWADFLRDTISRSNLDGSGVTSLVSAPDAIGLTLDVDAGHMYWADDSLDAIFRANLDGSGVTQLVSGVNFGVDLAVDPVGGRIYWTDLHVTEGGLFSANLDGTGITQLVAGYGFHGLALDVANNHLYWMNAGGTDGIHRAELDGSNPTMIVPGVNRGTGLDLFRDRLYWIQDANLSGSGAIYSANLDGSDATFLVGGLDLPFVVDVVPEPGTGLLVASGLIALGVRRRHRER